jgi:hypothetical protein
MVARSGATEEQVRGKIEQFELQVPATGGKPGKDEDDGDEPG